jgi:hypothetical protein
LGEYNLFHSLQIPEGAYISEIKGLGCGLWAILSLVLITVFTVATNPQNGISGNSSIEATASQISPTPLIATVIPQDLTTYFVVQNNQIIYSYEPTFDTPCNYIIQGQIFDFEGEPFTDAIINIHMHSDLAPERPAYASPGEGPESFGPSGWAALLSNWNVNYRVWLTTSVGGVPVSPVVYVETKGCNNNVATLNFIQVRPFS